MINPIKITFRGLHHSQTIESEILDRASKIEHFHDRITSCRVMVEARHHHHHKGRIFHVRIDITLPGCEIVASRDSDRDHSHEDVYVAIRDAFDSVRRQLQTHVDKERGFVKRHHRGDAAIVQSS